MALFGSKTSKTDKTEDKKEKTAVKTAAKPANQDGAEQTASMKDLYAQAPLKSVAGKSKSVAAKFTVSNRLLIRPLITEKATTLAADNKYVFVVSREANKIEVAKAIKSIYGVTPTNINVVNMKGKRVVRGRIRGQRKDWKKAVVTLAKGDSIAIYEGV